jgi:hypothetical protein
MLVRELIQALKYLNQDDLVVVKGYEGGYNDVTQLLHINIVLDVNEEWYYGKHADKNDTDMEDKQAVKAILIS